jgi:hypothetical protein
MADFSVSDVASKIKAPEGISLADMMNMARSAQAYKQAQQINPLLLRQQEAATTEAEETLQPKITQKKAESETAVYGANTAHLKNILDATSNGIQQIQILQAKKDEKGNPIATPKDVEDMLTKTINSSNQFLTPEDKKAAITQALQGLNPNASPTDVQVFLAQKHLSTLSTQADAEKRYPAAYALDIGGKTQYVQSGNKLLTGVQPGTPQGPAISKTLAPQIYTKPTGLPGIIGGEAGNVPQEMTNQFQNAGGINIAPGETYEGYKSRVNRLTTLPTTAKTALNSANVDSIPNMVYNNNKVLELLDKKNLDIGPVQKAIAEKTGGAGLNSDQQLIQKYLEQRIRLEAARTNQDQDSQRTAFGNFGTSKDALREIIYNDKGRLAAQKLYHQGVLNNQGDPNKPNLNAINKFDNEFSQIANDPNLTHLLGVIGDKTNIKDLTMSEKNHLKKQFGNLTRDQFNDLMTKAQNLKNFSFGNK